MIGNLLSALVVLQVAPLVITTPVCLDTPPSQIDEYPGSWYESESSVGCPCTGSPGNAVSCASSTPGEPPYEKFKRTCLRNMLQSPTSRYVDLFWGVDSLGCVRKTCFIVGSVRTYQHNSNNQYACKAGFTKYALFVRGTADPPPTPTPTSPTPAPTPAPCSSCNNNRNAWMVKRRLKCGSWGEVMFLNYCKHNRKWRRAKTCQQSCYEGRSGYNGDVCCPTGTCTACDNERSPWMKKQHRFCESSPFITKTLCTHRKFWRNNKFCQQTCFDGAAGYPGDNCCSPLSVLRAR